MGKYGLIFNFLVRSALIQTLWYYAHYGMLGNSQQGVSFLNAATLHKPSEAHIIC